MLRISCFKALASPSLTSHGRSLALSLLTGLLTGQVHAAVSVTTYHGDVGRTGWNAAEAALTPSVVSGSSFQLLGSVALDDQVDVQPLYVAGQTIAGAAHDVVYVATENNTVYAIDAATRSVLLQRNLGAPVPLSQLPGQCNNNGANVGISGTPVIDPAAQLLYVIAYTYESGQPVYRIHALDLGTLVDATPAVVVSDSHALPGGHAYAFTPYASRQRTALLLANGNVYAGFASFCDQAANVSRGWVLGWKAGTLAPLPKTQLLDRQPSSPDDYFLNAVWMSGYGIAADEKGSLFFVTSNTDPSGQSYNKPLNYSESVLKLKYDLSSVESYFTPAGQTYGVNDLDAHDADFGAGGALVIPEQPGHYPRLAVAAGKVGMMYLLNRDSLGGFGLGSPDRDFGRYNIGGCWCGESYFAGADGIGRVVSSGGGNAIVWKILTSRTGSPSLAQESISAWLNSGQDPGFFTTVSSNGTIAGSQIIWAVARAVNTSPGYVTLLAFDPSSINGSGQSATLFSGVAGTWPNGNANADIVPLVANGQVFVASYQQLAAFGVAAGHAGSIVNEPGNVAPSSEAIGGRLMTGIVQAIDAPLLTIRSRTGAVVSVDVSAAAKLSVIPELGGAVTVRGGYDARGVLHATTMLRAKNSDALWEADR